MKRKRGKGWRGQRRKRREMRLGKQDAKQSSKKDKSPSNEVGRRAQNRAVREVSPRRDWVATREGREWVHMRV